MSLYEQPGPGNRELILDPRTGLTLELRGFYQQFVKGTTEKVIQAMRCFFQDNPRVPDSLRWVGTALLDENGAPVVNPDGQPCLETSPSSGITIGAEYGDLVESYPSILVSSVSGNINDLWLNNQKTGTIYLKNPRFDPEVPAEDRTEQEFIEIGERLSGKCTFTVALTIRDQSKPARDLVTDLLLHGLVGPIRRDFHRLSMNWLPDQGSIGGDGKEELTSGTPVHTRSISFGLQTEWADDFFYPGVTVTDIVPIPLVDEVVPSV